MNVNWPKSILPKGLYARAALILILPIIIIQLVVSVVFIQRHFDGVTGQLTDNVALELHYFLNQINGAEDPVAATLAIEQISGLLGLTVVALHPDTAMLEDLRNFSDLTGNSVILALRSKLPSISHVDLSSNARRVLLHVTTNKGPYSIEFRRSRVSASNPHQLLVLMIAVSIFMTLISFIFLRNQVRPIRRLAQAAEAFGKGHNRPYHIAGATEVRQAGQSFLDMRDRIERQIEQRTLMLSGVSHDLRTPLTRLKLGLSLAEQEEETAALIRDVDDMEEMLEEFLAFARGDSLEESEDFDPVTLVQQVVSDTERVQGEIVLKLPESPAPPKQVSMRPNAMRRALDNLVTNALRYGSHCQLSLIYEPHEILFTVEDDGPGIPPNYRDIAIRPFERLDQARNQNRGTGVGLGLAIAMDIASSHGGKLELGESEAMGGLKATLRLPV